MGWSDRRPLTVDHRDLYAKHSGGGQRSVVSLDDWESCWAPYDEPTYQAVLSYLQPDDIALDIGAGDLRLTRRMAAMARQVFAIEKQPGLLVHQSVLPTNLSVLCADARTVPWPTGITVGVLLMRHCTHVGLYATQLRELGCRRLITNARWGMSVELMDLGPRRPWSDINFGWYACLCGQTGFIPGPPEQMTNEHMEQIAEVEQCPACTL